MQQLSEEFAPLVLALLTAAYVPPPQTLLTYLSCFPSSPKVKYKSDLNLTRGIGWTPPGSYKVEMARRAAELAKRRGPSLRGASVSGQLQTHRSRQGRGERQTRRFFPNFIFGQRSAGSEEVRNTAGARRLISWV